VHFLNVPAKLKIWSPSKRTCLRYVSAHLLTLAVELHLVHSGGGASFPFELQYIARCRPHLRCYYYFASHK